MPFYPNGTWYNWTQVFTNITNSQSPTGMVINGFNSAFPWLWPLFSILIYVFLLILFQDAPVKGKFISIATIGFVYSVILAAAGYIPDAIINIIIMVIALVVSTLFRF